MVNPGRNLQNAEKTFDKTKSTSAENSLSRKAKSAERSDMFPALPAIVANLNENQLSDLDDFEPVGATDFELINFWPGLTKRDTDYGHLR